MAGSAWAWGNNAKGQIGDGTITSRSSPVQIGTLTSWSSMAGNGSSSLAIKTDHTLWAWGYGNNGQLGQVTNVSDFSSPVQVGALTDWSQVEMAGITVFDSTAFATKTDGTFWAWGKNSNGIGQLPDLTSASKSSPVQIGTLTNWSTSKTKLAAQEVTGMAIKTDGTLWTWGLNSEGEVGDGTINSRSSPVQIGTLTNWSVLGSSQFSGNAIKTDGTLWGWGYNTTAQPCVGDNTGANRSSPVQVGTLTNWASLSKGGGVSDHMNAIKTDGTLWGWGRNFDGAIGDNTTTSRSSPVQIGTLTSWSSVTAGGGPDASFTLATQTDGTLWTWGTGATGVLGDSQTGNRSSPVQVGTLTSWTGLSAGGGHTLAIQTVAPPPVVTNAGFFFFM